MYAQACDRERAQVGEKVKIYYATQNIGFDYVLTLAGIRLKYNPKKIMPILFLSVIFGCLRARFWVA